MTILRTIGLVAIFVTCFGQAGPTFAEEQSAETKVTTYDAAKLLYRIDSELGIFEKLMSKAPASSQTYRSTHKAQFEKVYSTLKAVRAKLAASIASAGTGGIIVDPSLGLPQYKELSDNIETQDRWLQSIYVEELLPGQAVR